MILATALAALALQSAAWTWTLYEGDGPVVLANEIPDTPQLKATLECAAGSGVARLGLYGGELTAGFANIAAGTAAATAQAQSDRDGVATVSLHTDHPAFGQFVAAGRLTVSIGDRSQVVEVPAAHLAKLRRFAELCGG